MGLSAASATHPDDLPTNLWLFEQAKTTGGGYDIRKRYLRGDGSSQWVENSVTTLATRCGPMMLIACRPIAEQRAAPPTPCEAVPGYAAYAVEMCEQLAKLSTVSGFVHAAELMAAAGKAITEESGMAVHHVATPKAATGE